MGRPKGSKNLREVIAEQGEAPKAPNTKKVEAATTYEKMWEPKPDMGGVEAPPEANLQCSDCKHIKAMHYGGDREWCNTPNCRCIEWKG